MPIRGAVFSPGRIGVFAQLELDACKAGRLHDPWPGWNVPEGLREHGSLELDQDAHAWNVQGEPEALRSKCIWNVTRQSDLSLHRASRAGSPRSTRSTLHASRSSGGSEARTSCAQTGLARPLGRPPESAMLRIASAEPS
jgi:hypothetical protein